MTTGEAYALQQKILRDELSEDELLDMFVMLDRPLTTDEFYGFYKASEEAMMRVETPLATLDTCGTGGDGLNTFNISTAAAILTAALDVPVAKHGNRSASSAYGSADVLEALGFKIDMNAEQAARCLQATSFCFMFAPNFHPAFKNVSATRKKFGKHTYFNFLGPLLNPAQASYRLVGVSDANMIEVIGTTLMRSGVQKAWVVRSADGMDEISPTGETLVTEFTPDAAATSFSINPHDYEMELSLLAELRGGDAERNGQILRSVLGNAGTPAQTNTVILNTAGALVVAGKAGNYSEGVAMARKGIQSMASLQKLEEIVAFSKTVE